MGTKKLSGPEKAAIVLLALGEDMAAQIVANMSQDEVRRIGGAMSHLGRIEQALVDEITAEFHDQLVGAKQPLLTGNASSAQRLMAQALSASNPMALDQVLDLATPALVDRLADVDAKPLATFLRLEHPQTTALLLAHVDAKKAGAVLKLLPASLHTEVIQRLANLGPVDPETIYELEETLRHELARQGSHSRAPVGGVDKVVALVANLDKANGERLLSDLEARDPELAAQVRERLFRFQDLVKIDDRGMQELLKNVKPETLRLALKQAPAPVAEHIYKNMSARAASLVRDDVAGLGKIKLADVEAAQGSMAALARKLAEEGKLEIGGGEAYV